MSLFVCRGRRHALQDYYSFIIIVVPGLLPGLGPGLGRGLGPGLGPGLGHMVWEPEGLIKAVQKRGVGRGGSVPGGHLV